MIEISYRYTFQFVPVNEEIVFFCSWGKQPPIFLYFKIFRNRPMASNIVVVLNFHGDGPLQNILEILEVVQDIMEETRDFT